MTKINDLSTILQDLLTNVANKLARETGFIQRQRQMSGSGFAQALILGGLQEPQATRRQQREHLSAVGVEMSVQGLEQRFTEAALRFLQALLKEAIQQMVVSETASAIMPQFNGIHLSDCSRIMWGQIGFKLALRWELQSGQLIISLEELTRHDQKSAIVSHVLAAGSLHLGDLGFFKLKQFADWNQQGVFWLSRWKIDTTVFTQDGQKVDLVSWLSQQDGAVCLPVTLGVRDRVACYLIAAPIPEAEKQKRLARYKEEARKDQRPLSKQKRALAGYTIYVTNIPDLTFQQAHILARTRWQIELLFKLWKSQVQVLKSRSKDPIRQQCEGYAKLIGALVQHWVLLVSGWSLLDVSPIDALRIVRRYVPILMLALGWRWAWLEHFFFLFVSAELAQAPPRPKRGKKPSACQLWSAFSP